MAALKKTVETTDGSSPQSKAASTRLGLASTQSEPVESGALQLRLHLEAALAGSRPETSLAPPATEKWPRPVRAAIFAGAALLPWSLIALAVHAVVARR